MYTVFPSGIKRTDKGESSRACLQSLGTVKFSHASTTARSHFSAGRYVGWCSLPRFLSALNFLYNVTEVFEFAARLYEKQLYRVTVTIAIHVKGIEGFVLIPGWDRLWNNDCAATEDVLGRSWTLRSEVLVADRANQSLNATVWFFDKLGWHNAPADMLRNDQREFLKRRA